MNLVESLVEMAGEQARHVLVDCHERSLMPSWVLVDAKCNYTILGTPWKNDLEKRLAEVFIRLQLRLHQSIAYSVVVEAWSATQPKDWKLGDDPGLRPMQRPDRKEVVIAIARDINGAIATRTWEIKRDHLEQIYTLEPSEIHQGAMQGWMVNLFKKASDEDESNSDN